MYLKDILFLKKVLPAIIGYYRKVFDPKKLKNPELYINNTVKSFWEFMNKLIEVFQWIMVSMISFISNTAFICWFAMNCLVLIWKINYE